MLFAIVPSKSNIRMPHDVIGVLKVRAVRTVQPSNALAPTDVAKGNETLEREVQPSNAPAPTDVAKGR